MVTRVLMTGIVWLILAAGPAWALSDGDNGGQWVQAPTRQKLQVANVLSRELGSDPGKVIECLDKIFADPKNGTLSIRDAAQQCRNQK